MCMFSHLSFWLFLPVLFFIVGLIFAIPMYDWLKAKRTKLEFSKRRFVRYDGLIATDLALKNLGTQSVVLREVGVYASTNKQPVDSNISV